MTRILPTRARTSGWRNCFVCVPDGVAVANCPRLGDASYTTSITSSAMNYTYVCLLPDQFAR
jgi:hypothetical protein